MSIIESFKANLAAKRATTLDEGTEQIQEVSDTTLKNYSTKAREQIQAIKSKRGPKSAANKATIAKREAGTSKAFDIQGERRMKEHDKHAVASHKAFKDAAHKVLTDAGYTKAHAGKASTVYTKHDPETNSLFVAKHHHGMPATRDAHHHHEGDISMVSTNGTTSRVHHNAFSTAFHAKRDADFDLNKHHEDNIKGELDRHERWSKESTFHRHMNEDVVTKEQILESIADSEDTLNPADVEALHAIFAEEAKAEPEAETIEEGRGRPRKDGTSAVGADREHIMMQMRKHVSLRGANPIEFADGSKHKITDGEARLAQVIHHGLRTSIEKGHFEKKLDASHSSFKDVLKNKETAGHAPKKHGITLPALERVKKLNISTD